MFMTLMDGLAWIAVILAGLFALAMMLVLLGNIFSFLTSAVTIPPLVPTKPKMTEEEEAEYDRALEERKKEFQARQWQWK